MWRSGGQRCCHIDRSMEVWWAEIQMWRLGESKRGGQVGICGGWVNLSVEARWEDVEAG